MLCVCVCACVYVCAERPDGISVPTQGTNPHGHKTKEKKKKKGRCAPSWPQLHIGSMQVHKGSGAQSTHGGGGDITASGCRLSAAVLIKQRACPERPVYGLNDRTVHSPGCSCGPPFIRTRNGAAGRPLLLYMYICNLQAEEVKGGKPGRR